MTEDRQHNRGALSGRRPAGRSSVSGRSRAPEPVDEIEALPPAKNSSAALIAFGSIGLGVLLLGWLLLRPAPMAPLPPAEPTAQRQAPETTSERSVTLVPTVPGNHPPKAVVRIRQDPADQASVEFSALFSEDADAGDEDHLTVKWDFGDGSASSEGQGTHLFSQAGTFVIVLTVTDPHGASATDKAKVVVPATAVTMAAAVSRTNQVAGLECRRLSGRFDNFAAFDAGLASADRMSALDIGIELRPKDDDYGLRFTGFIAIPKAGTWRFYLTSDDGSRLSIAGTEVAKMDQMQGATTAIATVKCSAGLVPIQVDFFQGGGGQELRLEWMGPDQTRQTVPMTAYFRTP